MLNALKHIFIFVQYLRTRFPPDRKQSRLYKDQSVNAVYVPNHRLVGFVLNTYLGHLESKERLRIQPAQLFNFS